MNRLTGIIKEDMKPALGVTEPGAIAFAAASARSYAEGAIRSVRITLNSGMYKNALTCGIPGTDETGNLYAAALGAVAGDATLGLSALSHITSEDLEEARRLIKEAKVEVAMDHMGSEIHISAVVCAGNDICTVRIAGSHTGIYEIQKNQQFILKQTPKISAGKAETGIHDYQLAELIAYVDTVPISEILYIREAFVMNMELLEAGLASARTSFASHLFRENGNTLFSPDERKTAQLLCGGAIEARVMGLDKPAMSITGSGAHGIIATLPLFAVHKVVQTEEEQLLRATALSHLITMYIKEYSGKLSAFCGCGIAAGTGMACGLAYLKGYQKAVKHVIGNMAAGITGMICDGGNQGCVMKGIVAVDAAFQAAELAIAGISVDQQHGILGRSPEATMKNMGRVASPGMEKTEAIIMEMMQDK